MRQFLLISLFAILISDTMLNLGLALAPGLSLKNLLLYVIFVLLVLEYTIQNRDMLVEVMPLNIAWLLLISYATFTWLVIILLGVHRGYSALEGFIALKSQLIDLFLFMVVYLYGPKDLASAERLVRWLLGIFVVVNVITLIDAFNIPDLGIIVDRDDGRLAGPVNEVNQYGAVLVFVIPTTAGLVFGMRPFGRMLFQLGTIVAFVLLGLTVSRGSFLGLFAGTVAALYLARKHVRKDSVLRGIGLVTIVIIISAAAAIYQDPEAFLSRFQVTGSSLDAISSGRMDFWRQALTMMSYWPFSFVLGYGWDSYPVLFLGYGDPHNSYLTYWFDLGLFGLGLYIFIAIWIVQFTVGSLRAVTRGSKPMIIGFLIGFLALHASIFFVSLYQPWLFIWAIGGTILRIIIEHRRLGPGTEVVESE